LCLACLFRLAEDAGEPPPAPAPPPTLGDYELLEEINRGGMGIVYRARQKSLDRSVAVKLILTGRFASEAEIKRFHIEAEAAARLDHPNIVPIYEVGEVDGHHFFSMKLIEGVPLSRRLANREAAFSHREAAALLATVARAVHHAHQHGILHRDLKPSNILLDRDGQPHLTDFGLARSLPAGPPSASRPPLTRSNVLLGTPEYMAPEQADGRARELTTAADVYALGVILYELLTDRPPFLADTPLETLRRVVEQPPRRPSTPGRAVDRDLEMVTLKCLAKAPEQRYPSALALAEDLERFLRREPVHARTISPWEKAWHWSRRRPALAVVAAGLMLLLTLASMVALVKELRASARARQQRLHRERFLAELGRPYAGLNAYRDHSSLRQEMGDQIVTLVSDVLYARPNKLRVRSRLNFGIGVIDAEIYGDGRTLTVYLPALNQYFEKPVPGSLAEFLRERAEEDPFNVVLNATLPIYSLLSASNPPAALGQRAGRPAICEAEAVEGAPTYELRWAESHHLGLHDPDRPPQSLDATTSVRACARQADGVLVKTEVDWSPLSRALEGNQYYRAFISGATNAAAVCTHSGIEFNPGVTDEMFSFRPPPGARKVDRIQWSDLTALFRKAFPPLFR
jgi:outer membrane lipoprotein-sorting protein